MNTKTLTGIFFLCALWLLSSNATAQNIATISGNNVNINNGLIESYIEGGRMMNLSLIGQDNLLANGGYGYFSTNDNDGFHSPNNFKPHVKINNEEMADFFYEYNENFKVEMHYVFRKDESGFYTYFVISDNDLLYKTLAEVRYALRVDKNIFDYAWTIEREGPMVHPDDLDNALSEIQDATYLLQDSSIYTKYDWAVNRFYDTHHGLLGNGYGVWTIEASREYINGGPTMQDLTLHGTTTIPILLNTFNTTHYGSENINIKREYSKWSKIWGPAFTYINTGSNEEIITDAKQKADKHIEQWPYSWLDHELYPLERGILSGNLEMKGNGELDSAMVLLCQTGPSWFLHNAHWQRQPYHYFFWDEADNNGNFKIENIRPGTYDLYAFTQKGKIVDELMIEGVVVGEGTNSLGSVEWDAGDKKKTIFQIGTADHKAGEFKLADLPRAYGRWKDTPDELTFYYDADNEREHWYYCQRENTYWDIVFNANDVDAFNDLTLRIALAGADAKPHIDAKLNGTKIGTIHLGTDSGIRRSSLTGGKYSEYSFSVDKELLFEGENTLQLYCYGSASEYKGVMYDAVLLEANTDVGTGISLFDENNIKSYYSNGILTIHLEKEESFDMKLYSVSGALVYQTQIANRLNRIPLHKTGVFILHLSNGQSMYTSKVLCR